MMAMRSAPVHDDNPQTESNLHRAETKMAWNSDSDRTYNRHIAISTLIPKTRVKRNNLPPALRPNKRRFPNKV